MPSPYLNYLTNGEFFTMISQAGGSLPTGTASRTMIALEEYIFGVKPRYKGLIIRPCIPDEWKNVTVKRFFRNCEYVITIDNSADCGNSVKKYF